MYKYNVQVQVILFLKSSWLPGAKGRISSLWSSDNESIVEASLDTSFHHLLRKDPRLLEMIKQTQVWIALYSMHKKTIIFCNIKILLCCIQMCQDDRDHLTTSYFHCISISIMYFQGPVFRRCCFHGGVGGIKVSQQAHSRIEMNRFYELQYAVR